MTFDRSARGALMLGLALAGCAAERHRPELGSPASDLLPLAPAPAAGAGSSAGGERAVRSTILPGRAVPPPPAAARITANPPSGDVTLNFPNLPVADVARAVLGDILGVQYSVAPGAQNLVTLVTQRPVARVAVLQLFEESLRQAGLALVPMPGGYQILPAEQAKGVAPTVSPDQPPGYAREVLKLEFVGAEQLRKLIDPILPNVVTGVDQTTNSLIVSGTSGQRNSVRDLVRQFDVNWLRGVSFGLFVPQRTDARLIVPELDKVLNGPESPTKGLVRIIAMERLNGILAVSGQAQYLEDVRRWIEILDREGESAEARLFVYRVQNSRASDLATVLTTAFNGGGAVTSQPGAAAAIGTGRQFGQISPGGAFGGQSFGGASVGGRYAPPPTSVLGTETPPPGAPTAGGAGSFGGGGSFGGTGGAGGINNQSASARLGSPALGQAGLAGQGAANVLGATITSDETNNAVLVYGTPKAYAIIEDALRKLDVPPAQVLIEASISEVTLTDQLRYGLQSIFNTGTGDITLSDLSNTTTTPSGVGVPQLLRTFPGFSFLYADKDISLVLNALEGLTKVTVLSSPKLMVINNQTASLQVGNQVPVVSASNSSGLTGTTNEIDYRDTGVILKITPRVNSGGLVLLDIAQEVSDVTASVGTVAGNTSPTFSTRRIATSIAVQDGQTIALGGLISDNRQRGKTGLPYLSQIPIIGPLIFGRTNNQTTRTELLILLRPRVVRSSEDGRAVTQELIDKIKTVRGLIDEPKR